MLNRSETIVFRITAAWTAIGLAGGMAYREITKNSDFTGFTQLSVVHTHALVLGTVIGLGLLALERIFRLARDLRFGWFLAAWNVGLLLTVGAMTVNGILQVAGSSSADGPMLTGIAGLGHIVLTVGFVLLFLILGKRIRLDRRAGDQSTTERAGEPA
jgi:hypothetical protein